MVALITERPKLMTKFVFASTFIWKRAGMRNVSYKKYPRVRVRQPISSAVLAHKYFGDFLKTRNEIKPVNAPAIIQNNEDMSRRYAYRPPIFTIFSPRKRSLV